jgi:hypothetical protein
MTLEHREILPESILLPVQEPYFTVQEPLSELAVHPHPGLKQIESRVREPTNPLEQENLRLFNIAEYKFLSDCIRSNLTTILSKFTVAYTEKAKDKALAETFSLLKPCLLAYGGENLRRLMNPLGFISKEQLQANNKTLNRVGKIFDLETFFHDNLNKFDRQPKLNHEMKAMLQYILHEPSPFYDQLSLSAYAEKHNKDAHEYFQRLMASRGGKRRAKTNKIILTNGVLSIKHRFPLE